MTMPGVVVAPLLAVHISDGVLTRPWELAGFAGGGVLVFLGAWRIRDEEIPQVALLTAAFFVASLIRLPVGVVSSVHLLLNGLMGVILGRRAGLAIPVGLFLQAIVLQHGGYYTLGINSCIMALPALLAWQLFAGLQRLPWICQPSFRAGLVAVSFLLWSLSLVYCITLLATNSLKQVSDLDTAWANRVTFHPLTLVAAAVIAVLVAWVERRLENAPEFPLGLLVGELAVLATTLLNCVVLVWGGREDWPSLVLLTMVPHLFIAVVEGVILGFTVGFLVRVKPEMIGWSPPEKTECLVDSAH
jgi:cobalt/nickel transport system permease protein